MGEARLVRDKADKIEELIEEARSSFSIQLREAEKKVERWREEVNKTVTEFRNKVADDLRDHEKRLLDLIMQVSDKIVQLNRDALKLDKDRLKICYGALVRGIDEILCQLQTAEESNGYCSDWRDRFTRSRNELIELWKNLEIETDESIIVSEASPQAVRDEAEEGWSEEKKKLLEQKKKLDDLLHGHEALRSKWKKLGEWFEHSLQLWQEVESASRQDEQALGRTVTLAQKLDRILLGWQAQTHLRIIEPASGDLFNTDEMEKAGETPVPSGNEGRVVELRRRGYAWGGRVLAPAAVVVGVKRDG